MCNQHSCIGNTRHTDGLIRKTTNLNTTKEITRGITLHNIQSNSAAFSSLNDLGTALRKELETKENSQLTQETNPTTAADVIIVPTASALFTRSQQHTTQSAQKNRNANRLWMKSESKPCIYCNDKHRNDKCPIAKSADQRRTILKQKRRCFNCLRSGHTKYQCRSQGRCPNCEPNSYSMARMVVRSVTLKTAKGSLLSRPITKLYPIEVSAEVINKPKDSHQVTQTEETSKTTRPIRIAAKQAAQRIKEISKLD